MSSPSATPFWRSVQQVRAQLPDQTFITSVEDVLHGQVEGRVFAVDRETAAQRLVERSHKLSTPEEVAAYHSGQAERSRICAEIEFRRRMEKNGPTIMLSNEQAVQLGAMPPSAPASPAANGDKKKGAI